MRLFPSKQHWFLYQYNDLFYVNFPFRQSQMSNLNVLKAPAMLKRLNELDSLSEPDRDSILYALDGLLRDAKARKTYAL